MIRLIALMLNLACVATVLTAGIGIGILWYQGRLTPETVNNVRDAITGQTDDFVDIPDVQEQYRASNQEIVRERSLRVLALDTREVELGIFKSMLAGEQNSVIEEQQAFQKKQEQFDAELAQFENELTAESTEQARAVLAALTPSLAVDMLMDLPLEDGVLLLQGLPEKTIAKILSEFQKPPRNGQNIESLASRRERANNIFEALKDGGQEAEILEEARRQLADQNAPVAN